MRDRRSAQQSCGGKTSWLLVCGSSEAARSASVSGLVSTGIAIGASGISQVAAASRRLREALRRKTAPKHLGNMGCNKCPIALYASSTVRQACKKSFISPRRAMSRLRCLSSPTQALNSRLSPCNSCCVRFSSVISLATIVKYLGLPSAPRMIEADTLAQSACPFLCR